MHSDPVMCLETQVQQSIFNLHSSIQPTKIKIYIESGLLGAEDKTMKKKIKLNFPELRNPEEKKPTNVKTICPS